MRQVIFDCIPSIRRKQQTCYLSRSHRSFLLRLSFLFDLSGTHDTSGVTVNGPRSDVLESNFCWVWWPGNSSNGLEYSADCLKNGLIVDYCRGDRADTYDRDDDDATISSSTISLVRNARAKIIQRGDIPSDDSTTTSLSDLKQLKRMVSPLHESAKDQSFRHRVFDQWSRRGFCP